MRVIRRAPWDVAERMERLGIWRREYDCCTGAVACYRLCAPEEGRGDADVLSQCSPTAISAPEMELNCSRSQTRGLTEVRRLERAQCGKAPEDRVERVQAKVRVWAQVRPAKRDILRVWPQAWVEG